ncbi:endogenous retrovirus group K member 24 Gag polyprotein-like [Pipistrellus kuhlii]|uniref:Retroviral nucleocapsid Gag protein p24 C-terminal domain-containing protein n=1 Tax=Pipistrellus kuhlii TaxID=59472 RepID=A0A7J7W3L3_PIPKU|nr:endogenous retrovirus group K member 24 Gag polyprotein-like [Pipistrellus kuhlii]XP_045436162.1 endogenous retrovirus group K member 24 Gag polyprotein-like [Pipistrellus kuhlii]KAF6331883.1 hypothetical protein mPipKuh1_008186 [Pipistrellus kuhlii]
MGQALSSHEIKIIETGETALKEASRPPSVCSVSIDIPDKPKQETSPLDTDPPKNPPPTSNIYPALTSFSTRHCNDELPPEDQATLEEEAARYHNPDWPLLASAPLFQPPPYIKPLPSCFKPLPSRDPFLAPILEPFHTPPACSDHIRQAKVTVTQEVSSLKEILRLQSEHVQLIKEIQALEAELTTLTPAPTKTTEKKPPKPSKPKPTIHAFFVTRSQNPISPSEEQEEEEKDPPDSQNQDQNSADEASDTDDPVPDQPQAKGQKYPRLNLKHLKDLKAAVNSYGPTAPFTLTLLESLSDRWLTPNDWLSLARATLSGGEYVLWRTDFVENCRETAQRNSESKVSRSWTRDKLLSRSPYDTNEAQAAFPPGLLAQIQNAGLKAWWRLPRKGSATTSLAKIRQGPDEPYSDFVSRLTDAAERLVGEGETENTFIKHLAYENANPSCQETIRPHRCGSLSDSIKLCSGIGTSHAIGLAIGAALKDFTKDKKYTGKNMLQLQTTWTFCS